MTEKGYTYPWEEIPLILNVNLCGNVIIPLKKENINSFLTFSKIKRAPTKVSALKTQTPICRSTNFTKNEFNHTYINGICIFIKFIK